jgi:hypothetical protein
MPQASFFLTKGVSQMASKELLRHDGQGELPLTRRAEPNDVPAELIRRQKNGASAFALACQSSGLEDKEIYGALPLDAGYFSRIKKGEATLQADMVQRFCDLVNNRIYPEWMAYQLGCTLVQIQSEAERRANIAELRAEQAEMKVRVLQEAIGGRSLA